MPPSENFVNIELGPVGLAREQVREESNLKFYKSSKRTSTCYYLISILILVAIIGILGGVVTFMAMNPGVLGQGCPTPVNAIQNHNQPHIRNTTRTQIHNTTMTTTHTVTRTRLGTQSTSTGTQHVVDPVAIATCLGVLENACAMENAPTTFGQCDPLFVFFYCDLTDMMVFRGAMKLDADGSSPVCQPMKKFCSKAIPLNRIPLADVSPWAVNSERRGNERNPL